jgi:hypothetical protein
VPHLRQGVPERPRQRLLDLRLLEPDPQLAAPQQQLHGVLGLRRTEGGEERLHPVALGVRAARRRDLVERGEHLAHRESAGRRGPAGALLEHQAGDVAQVADQHGALAQQVARDAGHRRERLAHGRTAHARRALVVAREGDSREEPAATGSAASDRAGKYRSSAALFSSRLVVARTASAVSHQRWKLSGEGSAGV